MPKAGRRVLIPLPDRDFDVTEVSVPWKVLTDAGHQVVFATESGAIPKADPLLLTGVLFGQLGAEAEPKAFYAEMDAGREFRAPMAWKDIDPDSFDGLLLPGGHAPGMRQYLASKELQSKVTDFWATGKPVAAICHGVLVLARATDPRTGHSLLRGKKTTCLPKYLERTAYLLTFWKLGSYYRTYPTYVEDEVKQALGAASENFLRGPWTLTRRGTANDDGPAFVVTDGNYVSARWPGDAYLFARTFEQILRAGTLSTG